MGATKTIVEHAFEAMTAQDIDRLVALVTPDCDWVDAGMQIQGPDQLRAYMQAFYTAFPDFRLAIRHSVESGDTVAAETRFTGTHTGPLRLPSGEVPPTGRSVELKVAEFFELRNGKVQRMRAYFDQGAVMREFGLTAAAEPAHAKA